MQDFNFEFPLTDKLGVTIWQNAQRVTLMMKEHVRKVFTFLSVLCQGCDSKKTYMHVRLQKNGEKPEIL